MVQPLDPPSHTHLELYQFQRCRIWILTAFRSKKKTNPKGLLKLSIPVVLPQPSSGTVRKKASMSSAGWVLYRRGERQVPCRRGNPQGHVTHLQREIKIVEQWPCLMGGLPFKLAGRQLREISRVLRAANKTDSQAATKIQRPASQLASERSTVPQI